VSPSAPRTAPEKVHLTAEGPSHPTWGRSEATQSGGVLLAPLPGERKCAITSCDRRRPRPARSPTGSGFGRPKTFVSPINRVTARHLPPSRSHAHRSLPARYSAERRHDTAHVCVFRHSSPYHRAGRIPDHGPRLPPRGHGLSRCP